MSKKGLIFVVAAPSGAGKTTLCKALMEKINAEGGKSELSWSVSYTTRPPRKGEQNGKDYFFVDQATFNDMVDKNEFAEWAGLHGNRYGTSRRYLEEAEAEGRDLLLEIDIQGARKLREKYARACFIFIMPPSWEALSGRLQGRGTEDMDEIQRRLDWAREEILEWSWFDYIIINDEFDDAVDRLRAVVLSERAKREAMEEDVGRILGGFTKER